MLTFAVFDQSGPASDFPLRQANLVGPDEIAIPGDIECFGGLIRCTKRDNNAAGLSLQFQVDPPAGSGSLVGRAGGGLLTLRTCLLPMREDPYLLTLELARHRIMLLLNKLEEWALFDLPADDPGILLFEKARQSFTHALVVQHLEHGKDGGALGYSLEADRAARDALAMTLEAGELLSLEHARVQHSRRCDGTLAKAALSMQVPANALTDHETRASRAAMLGAPGIILTEMPKIGVAINPAVCTPELGAAAAGISDFVTMPLRWIDMEPSEGKYVFSKTDKWIEWAVRTAKVPVTAGPILDFRPECIPEWLYIWEHDYETMRDVCIEHTKNLVTRYRRTVNAWTVASGLNVNRNFSFSYEQVLDLLRTCVLVVKKLHPGAKVAVEIAQPWGEYYADGGRAFPPQVFTEMMAQVGVQYDVLGVRVQMGHAAAGRTTRDLMSISAMLDRLAMCDRPLAITAAGCPSRVVERSTRSDSIDREPGQWRTPWSPDTQAEWLRLVGAAVCSKPYVQSFCWQDLYDPEQNPEMPAGGLCSPQGAMKPAVKAMAALREALKAKKTLP